LKGSAVRQYFDKALVAVQQYLKGYVSRICCCDRKPSLLTYCLGEHQFPLDGEWVIEEVMAARKVGTAPREIFLKWKEWDHTSDRWGVESSVQKKGYPVIDVRFHHLIFFSKLVISL
jgi:hypothetical protein